MTVAAPAPPTRRVPTGVAIGITAAWAIAVGAQVAGKSDLLHHDAIAHGAVPAVLAVPLFVLVWQVMVAAMMLPSTVPLLRMFAHASSRQASPRAAVGAFVGGYAVVWGFFGCMALAGDLLLHRAVYATPGLEARPWLVAGAVLVLAGAFQFSALKDQCLQQCRHPALWMLRHYRRGTANAFLLGRQHGLFCLGCCWALMLLMFAAGVANLVWMAALALLMAYEKIGRHGEQVARVAGVVLLVWGVVVVAHPPWIPAGLGGVS
jgi:predicted metal-binding membrane protein